MQVEKLNRKGKCCARENCSSPAELRISFEKVSVPVCLNCANKLFSLLSKHIVPHSIKNKFNLKPKEGE